MINLIKEVVYKLTREPGRTSVGLSSPQSSDYTEMISNDLQQKYEDRSFTIPIQFINFDAIIQSLIAVGHPGIQDDVKRPYTLEDFEDVNPEIAEVVTDYMNTHLKLLINSMMQEYLDKDIIKMSADSDGVKYYSDEESEEVDGLIELERNFRSV